MGLDPAFLNITREPGAMINDQPLNETQIMLVRVGLEMLAMSLAVDADTGGVADQYLMQIQAIRDLFNDGQA